MATHFDRIVVGVDGSTGSGVALRWALAEAETHGVGVHAVLAWQDSYRPAGIEQGPGPTYFPLGFRSGGMITSGRPDATTAEPGDPAARHSQEEAADAALDAAISDALTPDRTATADAVTITRQAVRGRAAQVLLDAVTETDLLVVGSRGHGGFVGALLGSVSRQVIPHARCPVVVVPTPAPAESG